MDHEQIIVFKNLTQSRHVVGEYEPVKAKAQPFSTANAEGIVREVSDRHEVAQMAKSAAQKTLAFIKE